LLKNYAEIENGVRVYNPSSWSPFIVRKDEKLFQEGRFYYADSAFFGIFSFHLLQGDVRMALAEPRSVVLTKTMAKKYFGDEDPMGKVLQINNQTDYMVTAVMEDVPSNSVLQFDFIARSLPLMPPGNKSGGAQTTRPFSCWHPEPAFLPFRTRPTLW